MPEQSWFLQNYILVACLGVNIKLSCFDYLQRLYRVFETLNTWVYNKMERTIPGFDKIVKKVKDDLVARLSRQAEKKLTEKRAEMAAFYGQTKRST